MRQKNERECDKRLNGAQVERLGQLRTEAEEEMKKSSVDTVEAEKRLGELPR